ncbi:MAG: phenylacetate--CoA ligase [Victivallales bacterium]|nr:phenylacetate--CoA ligase [Victivallales bacterium]
MDIHVSKSIEVPFHPLSAADYLPGKQLRELQLQRLKRIVKRAYDHVKLYRERMEERNFTPDQLRSLEDLSRLPFTVKADLRDTYPFGMFAAPMEDIVRLHASSGTTGKPIVVAYTQRDLDVWQEALVRAFSCCSLHKRDMIQNAYGYGLFTGGLGVHCGAEGLGATVVPISGGNTERQLMLMKDFNVTCITCTPSYFNFIIERGQEIGYDFHRMPLRVGIFGAEPWTNAMRHHMEEATGIKAYDIYGLSEIVGPGVGCECAAQNGLHIFEDHFYPEIIDPDTGAVLPDGSLGELVLTTLSKDAMPMLRYRTRDLTRLITEKCPCGRTIRRIERISSRSDDMFIIRGVNVFPSQIEAALLAVKGVMPHYLIILTTENSMDSIEVQVEITPDLFSDRVRVVEDMQKKLSASIEHTLGLRVRLKLVAPGTIPRSEGKAKRVIDKRHQ